MAVALVLVSCASDPREYDGAQATTDGGLAGALKRYEVVLPCEDGLRYLDDQDVIGSHGQLSIKLTPSEDCLRDLLVNLGMEHSVPKEGLLDPEVFEKTTTVGKQVGWELSPDASYTAYQRELSQWVTAELVVDRAAEPMTVYLAVHGYASSGHVAPTTR